MPVRRPRDIEDDAVSEKPWSDGDETEEAPARRKRSTRASTRSARDDEHTEEDEPDHEPRRSSRVRKGWEAYDKSAKETGGGDDTLKPYFRYTVSSDEPKLVRFLDSSPISYLQHWISGRPYMCLEEDCPACDSGHDPKPVATFTVVDLSLDEPLPLLLNVTAKKFASRLETLNDDRKYGPLTANYVALSREGEGKNTTYTATYVKERDLEEDFDITPEEAQAICEEFDPVSEDHFVEPTRAELREALRGSK
jgi:hypothetical protein